MYAPGESFRQSEHMMGKSSVGGGAAKHLNSRVSACVPAKGTKKDVDDSKKALSTLAKTRLARCGGADCQNLSVG